MPANSVRDDPHNAQGSIPFGFEEQPPAEGPQGVFYNLNADPPGGYDLDPALEPNKFPREKLPETQFDDIARSIP